MTADLLLRLRFRTELWFWAKTLPLRCRKSRDFADIMRLSGEEGASVYANLRARSSAMRTAMLHDEIAEANAVGERMTIPGSLLGVIFMALLVAPSLLRMFSNT